MTPIKRRRRTLDEEAEIALAALKRARLQAERIAFITNTPIVQVENGKIVHVMMGPPADWHHVPGKSE